MVGVGTFAEEATWAWEVLVLLVPADRRPLGSSVVPWSDFVSESVNGCWILLP